MDRETLELVWAGENGEQLWAYPNGGFVIQEHSGSKMAMACEMADAIDWWVKGGLRANSLPDRERVAAAFGRVLDHLHNRARNQQTVPFDTKHDMDDAVAWTCAAVEAARHALWDIVDDRCSDDTYEDVVRLGNTRNLKVVGQKLLKAWKAVEVSLDGRRPEVHKACADAGEQKA